LKTILFVLCFAFALSSTAQDEYGPIEPQYCTGVQGEIQGTNVNVRSTPSVSATIVTQLNTGDKVSILGFGKTEIIKNMLCPWFSVSFTDPKTNTPKEGWVYGAFIYYTVSFAATFTKCITGDFTHLVFNNTDGEEIDFYIFQDSLSPLKWSDLTLIEENYNVVPNPDYVNRTFRLTLEFLPSSRTSYDWDHAIDCKEEVLTGVSPVR
jgi:hypothetical protein